MPKMKSHSKQIEEDNRVKVTTQEEVKDRKKADCLILFFLEKGDAFTNPALEKVVDNVIRSKDFQGKKDQQCLIYPVKQKESRFLLVGLGKAKDLTLETIRMAMGNAIRLCCEKKFSHVNILVPDRIVLDREDLISALVDGAFLANYLFDKYKEKKQEQVKNFCFVKAKEEEISFIKEKQYIYSGVYLARDLVNENADVHIPQRLAQESKSIEKLSSYIKVKVLNQAQMKKEGMGLLLAVSQGAAVDPVLIVIEYRPPLKGKQDSIVLIGKGITYDTGGLCLKPPPSMKTMKSDMAGAASIIGTMHALAQLEWPLAVTAVIPATENAIGPKSYKTGDVHIGLSGKSVEIGNTDAEGRLILADAISYAKKYYNPSRIIDIASLTGAITIALGEEIAGFFSNEEELAQLLQKASEKTGEHLWRMPLYRDYLELMKSDYADINNVGKEPKGGAITAALFLQEFIDESSWAHIDFGSSSWYSTPKGYYPTHATGIGVRLLMEYFRLLVK